MTQRETVSFFRAKQKIKTAGKPHFSSKSGRALLLKEEGKKVEKACCNCIRLAL